MFKSKLKVEPVPISKIVVNLENLGFWYKNFFPDFWKEDISPMKMNPEESQPTIVLSESWVSSSSFVIHDEEIQI